MTRMGTLWAAAHFLGWRIYCAFIAGRSIRRRATEETNSRWYCRRRKKRKRKALQLVFVMSWKLIRRCRHYPRASESVSIADTANGSRNCFLMPMRNFTKKKREEAGELQPSLGGGINLNPAQFDPCRLWPSAKAWSPWQMEQVALIFSIYRQSQQWSFGPV